MLKINNLTGFGGVGRTTLQVIIAEAAGASDTLDAIVGQVMAEAASAAATHTALVDFVTDQTEAAVAAAVHSATSTSALDRPVTNIIGYWNAGDAASLALSGANVTGWNSQVGGSGCNLATNGGSTAPVPTYSATGFNSKPGVSFTNGGGGSTYAPLIASALPMGTGNTLTFWCVANVSSSSQSNGRIMSCAPSGFSDYNNLGSWLLARNGGAAQVLMMRNNQALTPTITYGQNYRFIGTIDSSGNEKIYVDGTPTSGATALGAFAGNCLFGLGGGVHDTSVYQGTIAECGVSTDFTNSTDVATLDAALQSYWGL